VGKVFDMSHYFDFSVINLFFSNLMESFKWIKIWYKR
jgi:hypothetical protein